MAKAKGITRRDEDYSRWYTDVIMGAELADYSPVKGCMVIRPTGFGIWERLKAALDGMLKATGHQNAYFPIFIPESFFQKEADHVEGFAPYVAAVTHGGGKKLEETLYVRPTSETIIYHMYAKWINSWRDLPLLINQWANVVRWEMRTRLFLRTTEFLWQEGHTAHETAEEAEKECLDILEIYRRLCEDYLAIPVMLGIKSESEKFAGAQHTYCIEAMMQDHRALQAGTSHNLGQNFSKAFDVQFQDRNGGMQHVWLTSWGVSTRLIGALIMTHSDDTGLVLPPRVAPIQVVIVPIFRKDGEKEATVSKAHEIAAVLSPEVSVYVDDRDAYKPGHKFYEWERKGVPIRLEIGPRDIEAGTVLSARRDGGGKVPLPMDGIKKSVQEILEEIQQALFDRALAYRHENTHDCDDYVEFKERIAKPEAGFFRMHWCGSRGCEDKIKHDTKATIRYLPLPHEDQGDPGSCIKCSAPSPTRAVFAKSY